MAADSDTTTATMKALPALSTTPGIYSGCCLALSTPLLRYIHSLLPPRPALVLSVGSGFGLLEAHLLAWSSDPSVNIVGVEVEPSPNQYLPASCHRTVHGTRFLEPLAEEATTWLLVYPRRVNLLREYMDTYGQGRLQLIIWIGPQADWNEYEACFAEWDVHKKSADDAGGRPWDMIVTATRPGAAQFASASDAHTWQSEGLSS